MTRASLNIVGISASRSFLIVMSLPSLSVAAEGGHPATAFFAKHCPICHAGVKPQPT